MIGEVQFDDFLGRSYTGIVPTTRADGSLASSMISYAKLGDRLYFSATGESVKVRTLLVHPRMVLVALNETEPNSFVSVEGDASIRHDNPESIRHRMYDHWDAVARPGSTLAPVGRAGIEQIQTERGRVIVELSPTRASGMVFSNIVAAE